MPAHAQTQSQIEEVLALIKRRTWQVLIPAVLTSAVGVMLATLLPRKYATLTRLDLVDLTLPLQQAGIESSAFEEEVWAAEHHIRSFERVRRVLEALEWEDFETLPPDGQYRYVLRVLDDLRVRPGEIPKTGAIFLEISYEDIDPNRAAQLLNELRDVYQREKLASLRAQAEQLRDQLQAAVEDDDAAYQLALRTYEELQRQHGISPTQQAPGGGRVRSEDPVFERLTQAEQELLQAQTALAAAQGTRAKLIDQLDSELPKVPALDQLPGLDLEEELAEIETAISEQRAIQEGLKPPNSRYIKAQKEIERLEREREELTTRALEPPAEVRMIPNPALEQLKAELNAIEVEIAAHEGRIVQLERNAQDLRQEADQRSEVYRKLRDLEFQVQLAMQALEDSTKQFDKQRRLADVLLQPEFSPFEISQPAFPPSRPSSPNVPFVIVMATLVGLALGLVFALLAEFGRTAFRGPVDIGRALPVPVLGVVNEIITMRQRRTRSLRRGLVGVTTLTLASALLWLTWAYENQPRLLGQELVIFLDGVRESLR